VTSYVTAKVKTKHIAADVTHGMLMTAAHARHCIETIRTTCNAAVEPVTVTELQALVHTNEQHVLQVTLHIIMLYQAYFYASVLSEILKCNVSAQVLPC
jgi:hypothetical protein